MGVCQRTGGKDAGVADFSASLEHCQTCKDNYSDSSFAFAASYHGAIRLQCSDCFLAYAPPSACMSWHQFCEE